MPWIVTLVGISNVAAGAMFLVKPSLMKEFMHFWSKEGRMYAGGVVSFAIGVVFLFSASRCAVWQTVALVGVLALVKGVLIFLLGPQKMRLWMDAVSRKSDSACRAFSLVSLALGVLLVYSA